MKTGIFVGIDLGTTGTKMILMDTEGTVLDRDYVDYPILNPQPGWAEQQPLDWWEGLCRISNNMMKRNPELKKSILGIGISGQMHTQVYLDKNNQILRNAITWMDQRSQNIVEEINEDTNKRRLIYEHTSNFLTTTYTAPHVLWVKRNEPDLYQKINKVLIAKDYIKYKLTGEMSTDYSDASGTLFFNVRERHWSDEMFNLFDIQREFMPEVAKSALVIGEVTSQVASETGLPEGVPVINGSADHAATSLGAGVINNGDVTAIIGTAGVVSVLSDKHIPDEGNRTICWNYCLEDKWVNLGLMQTAGESLNWFRRVFDGDKDDNVFTGYNREIANIPDGAEGLLFLPYLMGERTPHWDANARGVFFGMSLNHEKYHFVKAIMEGVGYAFRDNIEVMESLGLTIRELRLLGGGSKSHEWMRILGKQLNKPLSTVRVTESGALGSSLLCGMALGVYNSLEEIVKKLVQIDERIYYPEASEVYDKNYAKFKKLYVNIKNLF